ncbi:hypothetical protein SELMODRAFT_417213 [Selaginella moellendorffii]|uniref:Uncharacterized protein n=1 Tax=Selaginella moellendorffii TaxID=88036 RepID=D8S1R3_SELML|nr:uncharacterized protein LOC9638781 isoform X2 [Selaginella moellendorffii]EFJ21898.1 hypothetical protein SELMODRAFT_417213 [Selaginella moellendorffii]|eukprot:XP_002977289.1 uncharacterized protein LOC9638781 isoform X2 [Selaginella moellendorffii]
MAALAVYQRNSVRCSLLGSTPTAGLIAAQGQSGKKSQLRFPRFLSNAEILTCLCTACNAIKFLTVVRCSSSPSAKHEGEETRGINYRQILATGEGICLSAAVVSQAGCLIRPSSTQEQCLEVSPGHAPPRQLKYAALSTWQLVPLWLALLINIILRSVQPQPRERILKESSNLALAQRVASLEHDFLGSVTLIRALTRQLEKLGVRVQVTKRTLQDPIHQTAKLAADMASAVKALSHRETLLEEELKETRSALMAIQDQQAKQLELISLLASRLSSSNRQGQKAAKKKMNDDYKYDYWLANTGEEICTLDSKR